MTEQTYRDHLNSLQVEIEELRAKLKASQAGDLISRQAAIDLANDMYQGMSIVQATYNDIGKALVRFLNLVPSAQPTLHGYNIEHLELIARVLQKEDLPPERVVEALTDTGRIVAIVIDEFEETLRRSVRNIGRRTDEADNRKE